MEIAYIALGSNIGDRRKNICEAIRLLGEKCHVLEQSSIYETEPKYVTDQPKFLNSVVKLEAPMEATELLAFLHSIEKKLGRDRQKVARFGPRTIDLDILFFGNRKISTKELTVPHPRMHERAFVLVPLYEVNPSLEVKAMLEALPEKEKKEVIKTNTD